MNIKTIPHFVRSAARQFGPKPFFIDVASEREHSWLDLKNDAWAAAAALIECGVTAGEGIALIGFEGFEGFAIEIGCQAAGVYPFVAGADVSENDLIALVLASRCSRFVIDDSGSVDVAETLRRLEPVSNLVRQIPVETLRRQSPGPATVPDDESDDPSVESRMVILGPVLPASAFPMTTPDGRLLVVSLNHQGLFSTCSAVARESMADPSDVWMAAGPLSRPFFRISCLYCALVSGGVVYSRPPAMTPLEALFMVRPSIAACGSADLAAIEKAMLTELDMIEGVRGRITRWGYGRRVERIAQGRESSGFLDSMSDLAVERLVREIPGGSLRIIMCDGPEPAILTRNRFTATDIDVWAVSAPAWASCFLAISRNGSVRTGSIGRALSGNSVTVSEFGELVLSGPAAMECEMCQAGPSSNDLDNRNLLTGLVGRVDSDGFVHVDGIRRGRGAPGDNTPACVPATDEFTGPLPRGT